MLYWLTRPYAGSCYHTRVQWPETKQRGLQERGSHRPLAYSVSQPAGAARPGLQPPWIEHPWLQQLGLRRCYQHSERQWALEDCKYLTCSGGHGSNTLSRERGGRRRARCSGLLIGCHTQLFKIYFLRVWILARFDSRVLAGNPRAQKVQPDRD